MVVWLSRYVGVNEVLEMPSELVVSHPTAPMLLILHALEDTYFNHTHHTEEPASPGASFAVKSAMGE